MSGEQKIAWIDGETTGLDSLQNDLLTFSVIIEIDGKVEDKLNLEMQPFNYQSITDEALRINGMSVEQIKKFPQPHEAHNKLEALFSKYVDKYNKNDKFIPAGYNVGFDVDFLFKLFQKCGDPYCGSYIDYHKLDIASIVLFFKIHGLLDFEGYKLVDVVKVLNVELNAHKSEDDIIATRQIYYKLMDKIELKK